MSKGKVRYLSSNEILDLLSNQASAHEEMPPVDGDEYIVASSDLLFVDKNGRKNFADLLEARVRMKPGQKEAQGQREPQTTVHLPYFQNRTAAEITLVQCDIFPLIIEQYSNLFHTQIR